MLSHDHFAVVGDCAACGGQMVETSAMELDGARHVQLRCQDCRETGELEHHLEDGPITNASCSGVSNPALETVRWARCLNCRGSGEVVGCVDDICHGKGRCIHDGNDACPDCFGSGRQPRIVETDGGLSDDSKDVLITATADQLAHKRPENLLPSEEVYWSVAGKPRQTEPGRTVWFAHDGRIHARGEVTKLESGYLWFDAAHETDVPCLDDAPSRGFTYIEPLRPRLADDVPEVATDGGEETIECCLECGGTNIWTVTGRVRGNGPTHDGKHRCRDCQASFETPARREKRQDNDQRRGLARTLSETDADDVGRPMTDGGQTTDERVPAVFTTYEDGAEFETDESGAITNHDELVDAGQTYREIRLLSRQTVETYDVEVVDKGHRLWCDEVADLERGETLRVDELRGETDD